MKTYLNLFAFVMAVLCCSCSDQIYVQAPCALSDLDINGSLAQELSGLNGEESAAASAAQVDLSINYGTGDSYRVQIFSSDPSTDKNSYLLAYYMLSDESTTELLCNLPENINNLYVGITDSKGNRVVKSVAMLNGKANVEFSTLMAAK